MSPYGAGSHVVSAGHVAGGRISTVEVETVTLDEDVSEPVAFIKIDAEGPEPLVWPEAALDALKQPQR